jgi:hypothetical protein
MNCDQVTNLVAVLLDLPLQTAIPQMTATRAGWRDVARVLMGRGSLR